VLGIFLLPHLGSRLITGWLYNSAGSSVLIAGLFHSTHNAIVNPTSLVAVVALEGARTSNRRGASGLCRLISQQRWVA
jgi:hypothetical protein